MSSWEKEATYVKAFAAGRGLPQTLKALQIAKHYHNGQNRKTGEPYIVHPVRVCAHLIAIGIIDDEILAAALLHDVLEDTGANTHNLKLNGISEMTCMIIELLSKKKGIDEGSYYSKMSEYPKCCVVKIADRCNNVATMSGAFSVQKIEQYVHETETWIYDLCKQTKDNFPEYSNQVFAMRYQLDSTMAAYKMMINQLKAVEKKEVK